MEHGEFIDGENELPKDFYSSNTFTDYFIKYLKERTDGEKEKPFLGYLAFTAPHWPLQAPPETVRKYKGMYDDGPEALRQRRLANLIAKKIVPEDVEAAPMMTSGTKAWADMSEEERRVSARTMEVSYLQRVVRWRYCRSSNVSSSRSSLPWLT